MSNGCAEGKDAKPYSRSARRDPSRVHEVPASEGHFCRSCGDMKRIGAPIVEGVVTFAATELLVFPAMYLVWRSRKPKAEPQREASLAKAVTT